MNNITKALQHIDEDIIQGDRLKAVPFETFLDILAENPGRVIRNVFQVFYDMIHAYVEEEADEYPDDPESIHFVNYDCSRLFIEDSDRPFFADRIFANRLINHVEAFRRGAQQNKIYIFDGSHGCGKSTFLNNLLNKFEEFANTEEGLRYEIIWRFNRKMLGARPEPEPSDVMQKLYQLLNLQPGDAPAKDALPQLEAYEDEEYIEVPCPSHDNPILMVPKHLRRSFFDDLLQNDEFKWKLFTEKEYEWVFRDSPCTICSSLYQAFLNKLKSPRKIFQLLYARPYVFNRRLGQGISVYNPGDQPLKQDVLSNAILQSRIDSLFRDSNQVRYIFSRYAKTNNGIYCLMDIKSHNTGRLIELHNIISEGVHKVEDIEENVNCLFFALMNPEDRTNIEDLKSFSDRIEYINIPYVLDLNTEVEIYRNIFGRHIDDHFLPRVLHNFARVILSTRINTDSAALREWIGSPLKYKRYCDENLQLLKMEIYTGYIPTWLTEEDRKRFTAARRRSILAESEIEGNHGLSGRDAIRLFNEFYSAYAKEDKLINMSMLGKFFTSIKTEPEEKIPDGFLDALLHLYNYTVLQEVKESLYYYNEEQIARDIQHYLFAVNFETGVNVTCSYTGEKLEITEDFLNAIENRLLGGKIDDLERLEFRHETQKQYTAKTLTQEILMDGRDITETRLYQALHERYVHNLKEKVLDPFLENENFRRAIKDYNEESFKAFDKRIRDDVSFVINNLITKYHYTELGAKEVCIYVIDNDLARTFANT